MKTVQKNWLRLISKKPKAITYFLRWRNTFKHDRSPISDGLPWIVFEAIDWLAENITSEMSIFEWGSGGSTKFFSTRAGKVISIEHDSTWFKQTCIIDDLDRTEVILIEPEPGNKKNQQYLSSASEYKDYNFERYVMEICRFPKNSFDLVFVDGRARVGCVSIARDYVRKGGFLILDNSERTQYSECFRILSSWSGQNFFGPGPYNSNFWQTTIWQKPVKNNY